MDFELKTGIEKEYSLEVNQGNTAKAVGSGGLEVFSTVSLIGVFEKISYELMEEHLPEEFSTVGIKVNIDHIAATPMGMHIEFKTALTDIDRKRLVFEVEAKDEKEIVAKGIHERFIIEKEKFMEKAKNKLS